MPSILFVCHANQFRSPIAAACFKRALAENGYSDEWEVSSTGTWAVSGLHATAEAIQAAQAIGINISSHISQAIVPSRLETYDLILTMQASQKEALLVEFPYLKNRVHLLSEVVDGISYDISDLKMPGHTSEEIAGDLCDLVHRGFPKICELASSARGHRL